MTADLVLKERAAAHKPAVADFKDAARTSDLTFVSIHTPLPRGRGVRVSEGGQHV